jgi:ADP-dependent NAD(P)H-hydrate dehydratase / NAD(P)H-hydrate epimerase
MLPGTVPTVKENTPTLWQLAIPRRGSDRHKYDFGHALVVTGELVGAARLAATAAQRAGAGLVSLSCEQSQWAGLASGVGSQLLWPHHADQSGDPGPNQALGTLLSDHRVRSVVLGSGWLVSGDGAPQRARVAQALGQVVPRRQWVLDAGALTAFAGRVEELKGLLAPWAGHVVLTPHAGEFEKLFGPLLAAPQDQAVRAAQAATLIGAVVVLKGAQTWIASPTGDCWRHDASDVPWLATAGTGDILAGLIAGLLAQGLSPQSAAGAGCWLQRQAARLSVSQSGGMGLIAEDVLDQIRAAWRVLDHSALRS